MLPIQVRHGLVDGRERGGIRRLRPELGQPLRDQLRVAQDPFDPPPHRRVQQVGAYRLLRATQLPALATATVVVGTVSCPRHDERAPAVSAADKATTQERRFRLTRCPSVPAPVVGEPLLHRLPFLLGDQRGRDAGQRYRLARRSPPLPPATILAFLGAVPERRRLAAVDRMLHQRPNGRVPPVPGTAWRRDPVFGQVSGDAVQRVAHRKRGVDAPYDGGRHRVDQECAFVRVPAVAVGRSVTHERLPGGNPRQPCATAALDPLDALHLRGERLCAADELADRRVVEALRDEFEPGAGLFQQVDEHAQVGLVAGKAVERVGDHHLDITHVHGLSEPAQTGATKEIAAGLDILVDKDVAHGVAVLGGVGTAALFLRGQARPVGSLSRGTDAHIDCGRYAHVLPPLG